MAFSRGHALIIGIGTYKYARQLDVPITTYDAKEVAEVLRDESYCGYPPAQVTLLHDTDATRDRIMQELDKLAENLKQDDTLFLFYSGHGMYGYGEDQSYYLTTHDSKVKQEEQSQRVIDNSGISEKELIRAIKKIEAKRIFQFFNACHSGELVMGSLDGSQAQNYEGTKPLPDILSTSLGAGEGRVTITACREYEQSSFSSESKLTFFCYALTEGLKGNSEIPIEDGCITISNLYSYVHRQVKASAERVGRTQEPKIFHISVGNLPIALHSGSILKETINNFSSGFKRTVEIHIEKVNLYEKIYSLLHKVEFECYNAMLRDIRRIERQKNDFNDLDIFLDIQIYLDLLNYIHKELKDTAPEIEEWCRYINEACHELENSISNKDLNSFKKANWYIEKVMVDETQVTNYLLIKTVEMILENLYTKELEIIICNRSEQQINSEIIKYISNLLNIQKSMNIYFNICNALGKISKLIINHKGELTDPILGSLFIKQIENNMIGLEACEIVYESNELLVVLRDWNDLEMSRELQKLNSLLSNSKKALSKINSELKKFSTELIINQEKLLILNKAMGQ